ncbi:MAG: hypothetical protein PHS92_01945 [Candidatus Gracilibacteria bacterium]|nr:hypothetical protein [Candidatus Gracilibacteria bacterium]
MKDIFDIKDVIFVNFFNQRFWIFFSFILCSLIFLWLIILIYRNYKKNIELIERRESDKLKLKRKYVKIIGGIKSDDDERFFKLNFYIRDYFEKSGIIEKSTKKTKNELSVSGNSVLNDFFETCEKAEFGNAKNIDFKDLKETAKSLIG